VIKIDSDKTFRQKQRVYKQAAHQGMQMTKYRIKGIDLYQGWANYGSLNIFCGPRTGNAHFQYFFVLIEYR